MQSWSLFVALVIAPKPFANPLFARETRRIPGWYSVAARMLRANHAVTVMVGAVVFTFFVALYVESFLVILLLPEMLLVAVTAFSLAPVIAQERVQLTWESLLVTMPGPEKVLSGKVAGSLWWIRYFVGSMTVVLFLAAPLVGFVSLILIPIGGGGATQPNTLILCAGVTLLPICSIVAFICDRAQQYILLIVSVVAVCTTRQATRVVHFAAITTVSVMWIGEFLYTVLLVSIVTQELALTSISRALTFVTLGPFVSFVVYLDLIQTILLTVVTLLLREVVVRVLWSYAVLNARRI